MTVRSENLTDQQRWHIHRIIKHYLNNNDYVSVIRLAIQLEDFDYEWKFGEGFAISEEEAMRLIKEIE